VGTPGTVLAKLRSGEIVTTNVIMFVCDEADLMIQMGSQQWMGEDTYKIKRLLPPSVQVLLFSATFSDSVRKFAFAVAPNPAMIILKKEELTLDGIKQFYVDTGSQPNKFQTLCDLYGLLKIGQSIVFVHTRETAKELARQMREKDYSVSLLHGADMSSEERDRVMLDFKSGKTTVLISTNVLARGIDVLQVTLVINYDIPITFDYQPDPTTYIHRIGRSGRFGRKGVAINFVHDDRSKTALASIAEHFGIKILLLPTENLEETQALVNKALGK